MICSEPVEGRASDTKHAVHTIDENRMIYGVEGGGKVKHDQNSTVFVVEGAQNVVMYFYQCRFSTVMGPVRRLKSLVEGIFRHMTVKPLCYHLFDNFREERYVGDWAVILQFVAIQCFLLQERAYMGFL